MSPTLIKLLYPIFISGVKKTTYFYHSERIKYILIRFYEVSEARNVIFLNLFGILYRAVQFFERCANAHLQISEKLTIEIITIG